MREEDTLVVVSKYGGRPDSRRHIIIVTTVETSPLPAFNRGVLLHRNCTGCDKPFSYRCQTAVVPLQSTSGPTTVVVWCLGGAVIVASWSNEVRSACEAIVVEWMKFAFLLCKGELYMFIVGSQAHMCASGFIGQYALRQAFFFGKGHSE